MTDIRDIKGPLPLEGAPSPLPWLAGGALLAVCGLALWRHGRLRQGGQTAGRPMALTDARAAWKALEAEAASLDDREFAFRLAAVVRAGLEVRGVAATARTAEEITAGLATSTFEPELGRALATLLERAEAAGYAGAAYGPGERAADLAAARALVGGRP
ncbi:hypothetical protein [Solidesulfovibrio magneticus]|uniref:DUF4129 domain-containing protein n=1 Tax=Solidesulfovibrio magneticus (strain ATCC 700980 / DSM 13731 / RS-1) TaxID=573370 RepID=C4XL62_SOLM1|nr:hypothetical protein [Solidesulfovibrio magneticus]BAH77003.1 hypothetical protein DMR_35120 [Solidesulfovibrio magneticus RS-1]